MSTLSEQVQAWLSEPGDYHTGLELLKKSGFSGFMLTILNRGDDAYTRTKLAAELTGWLNSRTEPAQESPDGRHRPIDTEIGGGVTSGTYVSTEQIPRIFPVQVRQLQDRAYSLMDERSELKAKLRALMNDPEQQGVRRDAAFRILAIGKALDDIYAKIDFYEQYGYLPPEQEPAADQDDRARLMSVRTYVSRYRAKLKKPGLTADQRAETEELLKRYEDEKQLLERKLT